MTINFFIFSKKKMYKITKSIEKGMKWREGKNFLMPKRKVNDSQRYSLSSCTLAISDRKKVAVK